MGVWRDLLGPSRSAVTALAAPLPLRSPWASTQLQRVVLADVMGTENLPATRAAAMAIPPVTRARGLICGTLSRFPLTLWQFADDTPDGAVRLSTPRWLTSTSTRQPPAARMLWTLDDLLFAGLSVWAVNRDDAGTILDAVRVEPANWSVDPDTRGVQVNGKPASDEEVIIFEGPQDGLLDIATGAVRASRNLANAWGQRVAAPVPLTAIKQTAANEDLSDTEIEDMIVDWEKARVAGGTAFIPMGFDVEAMGVGTAPDLYVEGRNAERLDWANFCGLPAAMLDGSMSTASLTYSTADGKRSEFVDYSLNFWASPIEARLSQDDVTPDGTFTRFDLRWLTTSTQAGTNPSTED